MTTPHPLATRYACMLFGAILSGGPVTSGKAQSLDWQLISGRDDPALTYAIRVGEEDRLPLYACRALAGAGVHPGRFRSDFNGCHIGFGGQEITVTPFEVLAPAWRDGAEGSIPPSSLGAGQRVQPGSESTFTLTTLYPCRTKYQGSLQVGEIASGDRGCRFGFGGQQVMEMKYQVLWAAPWMTWVAGIPHQIPAGAVIAGTEGGELFHICRAGDRTGLHPGKIKQSSPGCAIASEGKEFVTSQFSLLVPRWLAGNAGTIPIAALPAGRERQDLLYLCRARVRDTVQIGKITERFAACRFGMLGGEIASAAYDILSER